MNCGEDVSPPYITSYRNGPYSSSLASSASSSSASVSDQASVFDDASSQSSDDSSVTGAHSDSETQEPYCYPPQYPLSLNPSSNVCGSINAQETEWPKQKAGLPIEAAPLRQHPRRTSVGATSRTGCPPPLVRQSDRKVSFVDSLVGKIQHVL